MMSKTGTASGPKTAQAQPGQGVTELSVSGHLMRLEAGTFCIYHTPGGAPADPQTGLPSVRVSEPPARSPASPGQVRITTVDADGWIQTDGGALIRVSGAPAEVLVTIYQERDTAHPAPQLQVLRLAGGVSAQPAAPPPTPAAPPPPTLAPEEAEMSAHIQSRGDVLARFGEWLGERGSGRWIEGFALVPRSGLSPEDLEYQAVLGRGWLSPWVQGGEYCGSRGMALPVLGLKVRLRGDAAGRVALRVQASFVDGTRTGVLGSGDLCEAESLAPLEAFSIEVVPSADRPAAQAQPAKPPAARAKAAGKRVAASAPKAPQPDEPAAEEPAAPAKPPRRSTKTRIPAARVTPPKAPPRRR